jgi:Pyruvate/2-oxoacid:ferredoxin oxidoreductase delta subunit
MADVSPYNKFAERMFQKDSKYIPDILKMMVEDPQAELLIALPGSVEDMAAKLSRSEQEIEADLKDMFMKGLTFKREKGGVMMWKAASSIIQFHDASILWPDAPQEFLDLWTKYMEDEWPNMARLAAKMMPNPVFRVIPVGKSIEDTKSQVLALDDINKLLDSATKYAVTKCTCRMTMKKCDRPLENCIQLNRGAEYAIERGTGKELTKEETIKLIDEAHEAGLISVTMNMKNMEKVHVICNCCGCCCESLPFIINERVMLNAPSRFCAEVDTDSCSSCGDCEDRCWFNSIEVKDGAAVVDKETCMGCGLCVTTCPEDSISMIEVRDESFIPG